MNDNIVNLPRRKKGEPTGPVEVVYDYGKCQHAHVEVCEKKAECICRDCGEKLNPIWVLMRIATDDRIFVDRWAGMKAEMQLMQGRMRVKCRHCGKFTPVESRATSAEVMQLAQKFKHERDE